MSFTKVAPAGIGTEPGTSIQIGDSLLHSTGIDLGSGTGIGASITRQGNATFTGIVSASSFVGSGTGLTGVASTDHINSSTNAVLSGIVTTGALNVSGNATVTGNLGVSGVLTYEDVTNIDSVGVITARSGIKIGPTAGVAGTFFADGSYVTAGILTAKTVDAGIVTSTNLYITGIATIQDTGTMNPGGAMNVISSRNVETDVDDAANYHLVLKNPVNDTGEAVGLAFGITDTTEKVGAAILHERDSSGSQGSMKFLTRPNNAGPPVERLKIESGGKIIATAGNPNEGAFITPTAVGVGTTTTTGRNAGVSTATGTLIFNTTAKELQVWLGNQWVAAAVEPPLAATGGSKSTSSRSGYTVHTFTSPGTFAVSSGSAASGQVEVFVVGGGGSGGGGRHSAGGGAGALQFSNTQTLAPGSYTVTVGSGGATGPDGGASNNGANSVFGSITAAGGGGGGAHPSHDAGKPGGSGGGEAHSYQGVGVGSGDPGGSGGAASPANGWGNDGGDISSQSPGRAGSGGGGGAGAVGGNGNGPDNGTGTGGTGGVGLQYSTDGSSYYYAAGGGGSANPSSCDYTAYGGPGGTGGGGGGAACGARSSGSQSAGNGGGSARNSGQNGSANNSSPQNVANGGNAGTNTGSGGGGAAGWAGWGNGTGGAGGPGIVIVAYPTALTE